jgi:hypothetical protein
MQWALARHSLHLNANCLGCCGSLDASLPPANADMALCRARFSASAASATQVKADWQWHLSLARAQHCQYAGILQLWCLDDLHKQPSPAGCILLPTLCCCCLGIGNWCGLAAVCCVATSSDTSTCTRLCPISPRRLHKSAQAEEPNQHMNSVPTQARYDQTADNVIINSCESTPAGGRLKRGLQALCRGGSSTLRCQSSCPAAAAPACCALPG